MHDEIFTHMCEDVETLTPYFHHQHHRRCIMLLQLLLFSPHIHDTLCTFFKLKIFFHPFHPHQNLLIFHELQIYDEKNEILYGIQCWLVCWILICTATIFISFNFQFARGWFLGIPKSTLL